MPAVVLAMVAATLAAPKVAIHRSLAVPWVGAEVTYEVAVVGAEAENLWRIDASAMGPSGEMALAGGIVKAREDGVAVASGAVRFGKAGWHRVVAEARGPDGVKLGATIDVAVTSQRVDLAWYQAEKGHELRNVTMQLSCPDAEVEYWRKRGVIPAHWCGAMCGADKPVEHFVRGWSSQDAIAIDEFGGPAEACEKFCQGLEKVRAMKPRQFIAVWFTGASEYWARLRDTIDVFMPEIYLNYSVYNLRRFDGALAHAREVGVFGKLLPGLGINVVKDDKGKVTCRPTPQEIVDEVVYLKRKAPDLRGLAVFSYSSAESAVISALDQAMERYWLRPVIDVAEARVRPEAAAPGRKALVEVSVRNAGFMPAQGAEVQAVYGGKVVARWKVALEAQKSAALRAEFVPVGTGVVTFKIAAPAGVTVLGPEVSLPVARVAGDVVVYAPEGDGGLVWEYGAKAEAMGSSPAQVIDGPDGARLVWTQRGTGRFRSAGRTAGRDLDNPRAELRGADLIVAGGKTKYVLDVTKDELRSIVWGPRDLEVLTTPWRMNWAAWRGLGEAKVEAGPVAVVVTVPVENELIRGASRYAFFGSCVEITRWFEPKAGRIDVTGAGEGCQLEQRPGSFACQMGLGTRPMGGRLQVGGEYRDLYFGQLDLSAGEADKAGWLDFAWDEPYGVGMGVSIARKWRTQGSAAGYDVTRLYDASDWIEVAEVWGGKGTSVGAEWSRVYLFPHGPADFTKGGAASAARTMSERVWAPARLLGRG